MYEIKSADAFANMHSDKHINEKTYRTVGEFMGDQINFEQRKFENLKAAVHREEVKNLNENPHHPRTNPTSKKLVDARRTADKDTMLHTSMNNGILRK